MGATAPWQAISEVIQRWLPWLPWVRIAAVHLASDETKLKHLMAENGKVEEILEGLTQTKMHLEALRNLIETALVRTSFMAGRLGYTPGNPPPG
jgi:hypothetical protein